MRSLSPYFLSPYFLTVNTTGDSELVVRNHADAAPAAQIILRNNGALDMRGRVYNTTVDILP